MADDRLEVRKATGDDAAGISSLLHIVVAERAFSAIDRAWSEDEQRRYLESRSPREAVHVAMAAGKIVGCQPLDAYSAFLSSMAHVGEIGTFVLPDWRGRGVGRALFEVTSRFATLVGYRKLVIHVRASNAAARAFYARLGFVECGRLRAQVVIDGQEDDELLMERFLT